MEGVRGAGADGVPSVSDEPDDPLPAMRAQFDQDLEMVPLLARYARRLFDEFKAAGFDDAQALHLTSNQLRPPTS